MNAMIDGDVGQDKASPHFRPNRFDHKCDWCHRGTEELNEIEYCNIGDAEDAPTKFVAVCDGCEIDMKANPNIVMI